MLDNEEKILLYQTDDGKVTIDVRFEGETFWLTQKTLAEPFDTTVANINIHIQNIFEEGELDKEATIKDSLIVQTEGSSEVTSKPAFTIWICRLRSATAIELKKSHALSAVGYEGS
jgi:hypothetical protein